MRKKEILNLKWEDIDFKRKMIYLSDTKTNEKREIPISSLLMKVLLDIKKRKNGIYIFSNNGSPYIDIRKSFKRALEKAKIENFRFHDLRHTFASQLVMSGVDLKTVQELLGHKSIEMTMRYSHLSPDHKRTAVERMCKEIDTIWTPSINLENHKNPEILS